ncbi:hypothetical protein [Paludisphaera soli]|uniref:hypothetical protein n=1 Tax=Paludisphaera soli TaxID=2712865 RepID=UPI0013EA0CD0|nr:hypothetical protein [Paludisphaera soli]
MTHRRAEASLFALRLGAFLAAWALALASPTNARAGCAGAAHRGDEHVTGPLGLSGEMLDAARPGSPEGSPLKPAGCTGAFCSKPFSTPGADFSGGVDLRVELWACVIDLDHLLGAGQDRPLFVSEDLRPVLRRDFIFHPPR